MHVSPCLACQFGFHDKHVEMVVRPEPGVLGGQRCPCKGECADGWSPFRHAPSTRVFQEQH